MNGADKCYLRLSAYITDNVVPAGFCPHMI